MKSLIPLREVERAFGFLPEELGGMLERLFGPWTEGERPAGARAWAPRVDVEETEKEVIVRADLPGIDPAAVEVEVEDGMLVLRGERKEERREEKRNLHRVERMTGRFYRAMTLPPGLDLDKIVATGGHGVLTVTLPKKPEVIPRKVTVRPEVKPEG